jgi:membrane associated rhomboid family serine protease
MLLVLPFSDNIRSRTRPVVTIGIILTCVAAFVLEILHPHLADTWAFKPAYLLSAKFFAIGPLMVLQSMVISVFLHGGFMHIGGNMLFLWIFGDNVEDRMGHLRFLLFYLLCGIFATLVHSLSAVFGLMGNPHALETSVVGASGAIAGVLGAYLVLCPHSTVRTLVLVIIFIFFISIPSGLLIVVWFIWQLFNGVGSLAGPAVGVAYWAHIGGFALGYWWAKRLTASWRRPRSRGPRILNVDVDDV